MIAVNHLTKTFGGLVAVQDVSFGIVFQDPSLEGELTAYENMGIHGVLYGVPRNVRVGRIKRLLQLFDLL